MENTSANALETILIVDDDALNLTVLSNLLKGKYRIKVANNGETALRATASDPKVDLILLDIIMPDMSGYEVCQHLKNDSVLKEIPVIFTSGLSETHDIVKGFEVGGVDYVTKPYHPEEVYARVEVHLELKRAKDEIKSLLSKTLVGSIRLLIDMLTITQPTLMQQSYRIRNYAKGILKKMNIDSQEAWSIELATMLSHIGCVTISKEIMEKVAANQKLSAGELDIYAQYPVLGARFLENIPRLERTAAIVKNQFINPNRIAFASDQIEYLGCELLNMLMTFDGRIKLGEEPAMAYQKTLQLLPRCPVSLTKALKDVIDDMSGANANKVSVESLESGMVLAADLKMQNGTVLLTKDTEMNHNLIDMIHRLNQQGVCKIDQLCIYSV